MVPAAAIQVQAGMGPFGTNKLSIAAANAGVLGMVSTSGFSVAGTMPKIYEWFIESGGASKEDEQTDAMKKLFKQTLDGVRETDGVFGANIMVSAEMKGLAEELIDTAIELREEDPEMKKRFVAIFTAAGDPSAGTRTRWPGSSRVLVLTRRPSTRTWPDRRSFCRWANARSGKCTLNQRSRRMPASSGAIFKV